MTSPQRTGPDRARAFLVERYLPSAAAKELPVSTARLARLCADTHGSDAAVFHLYSVYLATEDTCFCLFQGPSAAAVRALNEQAGFALDRVTEAALVLCTDQGTPVEQPGPAPEGPAPNATPRNTPPRRPS